MKKKGFTLIELLAVIIILAVIAIITTPTILGIIETSKKESYRNSIYGIIESARLYFASNLGEMGTDREIAFACNGAHCSNEKGEYLDFKGSVPKSGTFYLKGTGEVIVESVYNGRYYANTVDQKVEITEEDNSLTRTELTELMKQLQQEVRQLKTQIQQSNQNTTNIASLQTKHDSDLTGIWNKVGREEISKIGKGSISQILLDQNKNITNLQNLVNGKVDATVTGNLSNQLSTLTSTVNNHSNQINNLTTNLNNKANTSHTHDDRYYTESEINTKLNSKANSSALSNYATSSSLSNLQTTVNTHTNQINNLTTNLNNKANTSHTHDDRYYTESEINAKLNSKTTTLHKSIIWGYDSDVTIHTNFLSTYNNNIKLTAGSLYLITFSTELYNETSTGDNRIEFVFRISNKQFTSSNVDVSTGGNEESFYYSYTVNGTSKKTHGSSFLIRPTINTDYFGFGLKILGSKVKINHGYISIIQL